MLLSFAIFILFISVCVQTPRHTLAVIFYFISTIMHNFFNTSQIIIDTFTLFVMTTSEPSVRRQREVEDSFREINLAV